MVSANFQELASIIFCCAGGSQERHNLDDLLGVDQKPARCFSSFSPRTWSDLRESQVQHNDR